MAQSPSFFLLSFSFFSASLLLLLSTFFSTSSLHFLPTSLSSSPPSAISVSNILNLCNESSASSSFSRPESARAERRRAFWVVLFQDAGAGSG